MTAMVCRKCKRTRCRVGRSPSSVDEKTQGRTSAVDKEHPFFCNPSVDMTRRRPHASPAQVPLMCQHVSGMCAALGRTDTETNRSRQT